MKLTGAQALIKSLELEDVEVMFGLPGGCILPGLRPASSTRPIRHILVRHEQGPGTWPRATPTSPAGPAWPWSPAGRPRPTWSRRCATPTWTRSRWWRSPAR